MTVRQPFESAPLSQTFGTLMRRVFRALAIPLLSFAAVPILIACIPSVVALPVGAAPLRYRDQVFSNITVTSDLQYGAAPGVDGNPSALKLDMYQPAGDTAAARPAVIWVHGGGYAGGAGRGFARSPWRRSKARAR